MEAIVYIFPNFQNFVRCEQLINDNNKIASIWGENMLGYLSLGVYLFREDSRKTVVYE